MNFQKVLQANGQNVTMFGAITEFKGEGINPNSGKPFKKVTIVDANNEKHTVTLRGTLPDISIQGQRAQFDISTYSGTIRSGANQGQSYTGYSGFWKSTAQVNQTAPQNAPQAPSQPAERPNDTQTQILRQCAGKIAAALVAGNIVTFEERFQEAERWVGYFKTGLTPNLLPAKERFPDNTGVAGSGPQDTHNMSDVPWDG